MLPPQQIRMAIERGRAANPELKLGICGEHGGDPASVAFFQKVWVRCCYSRGDCQPHLPGRG